MEQSNKNEIMTYHAKLFSGEFKKKNIELEKEGELKQIKE